MEEFISKAKYSKIAKCFEVKSKRPRKHNLFDVLNGILYVLVLVVSGEICQLVLLPIELYYITFVGGKERKRFIKF
jgi:hypothetical protein